MKKVIMAAAIVCAASFVHAAACTWQLSGIQASEKTAVATGSMIAYFMDGMTYDTFTGLTADKVGSYVVGNNLSSAKIATSRTGAAASATFGDFEKGAVVNGYIVIFDNSDATKADFFAYTETEGKTVPGSGNLSFAKAFSATTGWKSTSAGPGPGPDPVPEPTSGLLLVLGGAALALRRRR